MSRIDNWSQAEKDLYILGSRAILDDLARQQQEWRESWAPDSTSMDEVIRTHNDRMRQLEEEHKAWMARFIDGEAPAPSPDVPQGQGRQGVSGAEPATAPSAPGPGELNPRAADLAEASRLRQLPMSAWAEERQRLIRATSSNSGMFG